MRPTEELAAEHEVILAMLEVLAAVAVRLAERPVPQEDLARILEFLKVFADACHHGKEEEWLFPALERAGVPREHGPIGVMLAEHEAGRALIREMGAALGLLRETGGGITAFAEAAGRYAELLRRHIDKENQVLFPLADRVLAPEEQEAVARGFARIEHERAGPGRREVFRRLLGELSAAYL
jgi:hemerythrin-like domain-containing protein